MFAALNKADGVAKLLIDANAHMDATDKVVRGVWLACEQASQAVSPCSPDQLPPRRPRPSWRVQDRWTALMYAASEKADGVAKLLVDAKADLDATNKVRPLLGNANMYMRGVWLTRGRARPSPRSSHACTQLHPASAPAHLTHLHHRDCGRHDMRRLD